METAVTIRYGDKAGGRLQALTSAEGRFELTVPADVPSFLLAANEAVMGGRIDGALAALQSENIAEVEQLLEQDPTRTDIGFILAKLLMDTGQGEAAERWFRRLLALEPHAQIYDSLSLLLFRDPTRWEAAAQFSRLAHEACPGDASLHQKWARALVRTGRQVQGVAQFKRVMENHPNDAGALLNYLWYGQYAPATTWQEINEGYRQWGRRFTPQPAAVSQFTNNRDPQRRLRIAYLSPDFRRHAVMRFFEPVLDGHDRTQVEVFGYGAVACPDETTQRLGTKFDRYRSIHGQSADAIAAQIRADTIDVLIEIGGHVTGNRLDVLALKPAPVQVDFGGLSTTGLSQVDYRITDGVYDPPSPERNYGERCVHLPGGLSCFRPPAQSPDVGPLPAQQNGFVTFGSFNNLAKISPLILEQWLRILQSVPQSRLLMKLSTIACSEIRTRLQQQFVDQGIAPERIIFRGWGTEIEHLACFNEVDLLLDTYPYNGGITTLEGLWMAVPTLSLQGDTFVSRAGASILSRVGLEIFVAQSPDEYVGKALAFANQIQDLAAIRKGLRGRFLNSPLCDPGRMARELETAYREMWHTWIDY